MMTEETKGKIVVDFKDTFEIEKPLKSQEIHWNQYHKIIKKGEKVTVARYFAPNLVTLGVIKELPKKR